MVSQPPVLQRQTTWLIFAVLACTLLRCVLADRLGLTEDEAYYRLWSLAPALSFFDHPPMVAWLIAAGRQLAGDTEFGVRLLAPLLLATGALVQWRTALLLCGRKTVDDATWMFLVLPLLNVGGIIITPDLPSTFFYGLVVWGLAELDRSQEPKWWLAIGIFAGCGLLSKYTNLFAGVTILLWLLLVPANRKWFAAWQLWAAGCVCLVIASPVMIWNATHEWASFAKQFGRVVVTEPKGALYFGELVAGLAALMSPVIAALACRGVIKASGVAVQSRSSRDVLLAASVLPMLLYFGVHALHGRVQANWLAPIYPMLALCAAMALRRTEDNRVVTVRAAALIAGVVISAGIYAHAVSPLVHVGKDPTAQMRGWPELSRAVTQLAEANGAKWIATSSYGTTGELAFGLRTTLPVAQLDAHIRHEQLPRLTVETVRLPALYVERERRSSEALLDECFTSYRRAATLMRPTGAEGEPYAIYLVEGWRPGCAGQPGLPHAAPITP